MANPAYVTSARPVEICGKTARLECGQCGGHEDWKLDKLPPPNILHKHFATRGWQLRKRIICPSCASRKDKPMTATPKPPLAIVATETADAIKAKRREAHTAIELYFDIAKGAYREGYSDERIAQDTGLSVDWVAKRREEEFGPLKEPDELAELRRHLVSAAETVAAIEARFNKLCLAKGWAA